MTSDRLREIASISGPESVSHAVWTEICECLREYASVLEDQKQSCEDPDCACHHSDEHHEKLRPCPKCGGKARIKTNCSRYYLVSCLKCGYETLGREINAYWAAMAWNENYDKEIKESMQ